MPSPDRKDKHRTKEVFFLLLLGVLLGLVFVTIGISLEPKRYVSTISLRLKEASPSKRTENPNFLYSEGDILTSFETFQEVSEGLNLKEAWALPEDHILSTLLLMTTSKTYLGTGTVEIEVAHVDPQVAHRVAREIPKAYVRRKNAARQAEFEARQEIFAARINNQSDEIEAAEKTLHALSRSLDLPCFSNDALQERALMDLVGSLSRPEQVKFSLAVSEFENLRRTIAAQQAKLNDLERIRDEEQLTFFLPVSFLEMHRKAQLPTQTRQESVRLRLWIGAGVGLLWALPVAFFVWLFRKPSPAKPVEAGTEDRDSSEEDIF